MASIASTVATLRCMEEHKRRAKRSRFVLKDGIEFELGAVPAEMPSQLPPQTAKWRGETKKQRSHLELLEERYAELEREAAEKAAEQKKIDACLSCKWSDGDHRCSQPLIVGFDRPAIHQGSADDMWVDDHKVRRLCTDERLLWEPKPTRWERFVAWIEGLFA